MVTSFNHIKKTVIAQSGLSLILMIIVVAIWKM